MPANMTKPLHALALGLALLGASATSAQADGVGPGAPAPDFTLPDLDGKSHHLAELKNKIVVLEWFNPECPFVRAAHTKGQLVGLAKKLTAQGVVWLGINSSGSGKQGNGVAATRAGATAYKLEHPILLDPSGATGRAYGATNTPQLYVINKGTLVYQGAIDNAPDGEGAAPQGGPLVNYVQQALDDIAAGHAVRTPSTKPYGCSVKYGS
jgi:peroxiredoxin